MVLLFMELEFLHFFRSCLYQIFLFAKSVWKFEPFSGEYFTAVDLASLIYRFESPWQQKPDGDFWSWLFADCSQRGCAFYYKSRAVLASLLRDKSSYLLIGASWVKIDKALVVVSSEYSLPV